MHSILMIQKREIIEKTGGGCREENYSIRKGGQGASLKVLNLFGSTLPT